MLTAKDIRQNRVQVGSVPYDTKPAFFVIDGKLVIARASDLIRDAYNSMHPEETARENVEPPKPANQSQPTAEPSGYWVKEKSILYRLKAFILGD